jgi:transglutaminase-like putative cysteine protease
MQLIAGAVTEYLAEDEIVNWSAPLVRDLAEALRRAHPGPAGYAQAAFEHVRDTVAQPGRR